MEMQQASQLDLLDESIKPVIGRKRKQDPADHVFDNEQEELVMPNESEIENGMKQVMQNHHASLTTLLVSSALISGSL